MKSVDIFAETPDYILAAVARIMEEVTLDAGDTLIREGEPGDCLVHRRRRRPERPQCGPHLMQLTPGKIVGELALLDPAPRSASVTAITDAFRVPH
ncbi:MAG: cyclic nucleotide-binding domain-containing protein [Caldilineaceae bacterium]